MKYHNRKMICVLLFILLLISCNQQPKFVLNGTIDAKYDDQQIMLFTFKSDTIRTVDTTLVKDGRFVFEGSEYLDDYSMLSIGNYPNPVSSYELLLEKGTINMSFADFSIHGTPYNNLRQAYLDSVKELSKTLTRTNVGTLDDENLRALGAFRTNFKKDNINNIVGQKILIEEIGRTFGEDTDTILSIIERYGDKRLHNHPDIAGFFKSRKEMKAIQDERDRSVGQLYTDFKLQTPEGEQKKLSDYVGKSKYLFVEFWASWCGPCIADVPYVKSAYDKYKKEGLEVVSISLDSNERDWLNALTKIDAPWTHLSDLKGMPSEITKVYHIKGIPYSILLNQDGIIIYTNLRGSVLNSTLEQLLVKR